MTTDNIIPEVRALAAYELKRQSAPVKLNQNESPFDLSPEIKREILERVEARDWNRYPELYPEDVLERLGARHGLPADAVLIGNGSNELLQSLFSACLNADASIALPAPTFSLYDAMARARGASVDVVYLREDMSYDLDAWRRWADAGESHLLFCSPNNPTGSWIEPSFAAELCEATDRLVIVDEAYVDFTEDRRGCADLVGEYDNLIVLRTFSKAAGLAGVRLGYGLAHPAVTAEIRKVVLPYNVGHFALEVARVVLEGREFAAELIEEMVEERQRVSAGLEDLGIEVFPSRANFLLFRHARSEAIFTGLQDHDVLIRDVSHYPKLEHCLRVSVGTPEENDAFLEAMSRVLEEL